MRIESTQDPTNPAAAGATGENESLRDEFLRMLVAQLEHQNPLEPQNGAEFVAQLAQFATVEQGARTNNLLDQLSATQSIASDAGMAAFVGKQATVTADRVDWSPDRGEPPELVVDLSGNAAEMKVEIVDTSGEVVKTIEVGPQSSGQVSVDWDGTDDDGKPLAEGTYEFRAVVESQGDSASASVKLRGTVEAIEFNGSLARLRVGAASVAPPSIQSIGQ